MCWSVQLQKHFDHTIAIGLPFDKDLLSLHYNPEVEGGCNRVCTRSCKKSWHQMLFSYDSFLYSNHDIQGNMVQIKGRHNVLIGH